MMTSHPAPFTPLEMGEPGLKQTDDGGLRQSFLTPYQLGRPYIILPDLLPDYSQGPDP